MILKNIKIKKNALFFMSCSRSRTRIKAHAWRDRLRSGHCQSAVHESYGHDKSCITVVIAKTVTPPARNSANEEAEYE